MGVGFTFNPNVMTPDQMREVHRRLLPPIQGSSRYQFRDEQAVFGEVSYRLSDQFEILAGIRYAESSFEQYASRERRWQPFEEHRPTGATRRRKRKRHRSSP